LDSFPTPREAPFPCMAEGHLLRGWIPPATSGPDNYFLLDSRKVYPPPVLTNNGGRPFRCPAALRRTFCENPSFVFNISRSTRQRASILFFWCIPAHGDSSLLFSQCRAALRFGKQSPRADGFPMQPPAVPPPFDKLISKWRRKLCVPFFVLFFLRRGPLTNFAR